MWSEPTHETWGFCCYCCCHSHHCYLLFLHDESSLKKLSTSRASLEIRYPCVGLSESPCPRWSNAITHLRCGDCEENASSWHWSCRVVRDHPGKGMSIALLDESDAVACCLCVVQLNTIVGGKVMACGSNNHCSSRLLIDPMCCSFVRSLMEVVRFLLISTFHFLVRRFFSLWRFEWYAKCLIRALSVPPLPSVWRRNVVVDTYVGP